MERCEEGWEEHGDHCYLWSTENMSWTAAEDFCQQEGGHLASVTSNETRAYVIAGRESRGFIEIYLGGNDIENEGVWKWADCTPWELEFWGPGQPSGGGEDCLAQYKNYPWNDVQCFRKFEFVCSKKICAGMSKFYNN